MERAPPKALVAFVAIVLVALAGFGAYQGWRRSSGAEQDSGDAAAPTLTAPGVAGAKNASAFAEPATPAPPGGPPVARSHGRFRVDCAAGSALPQPERRHARGRNAQSCRPSGTWQVAIDRPASRRRGVSRAGRGHGFAYPRCRMDAPAPSARTAGPSEPLLRVEGLAKRYGAGLVFSGVSLAAARGELVALLGESGVGKSTLLNCIAGLDTADAGTITLAGRRVLELDEPAAARLRRETLGFVFQVWKTSLQSKSLKSEKIFIFSRIFLKNPGVGESRKIF